MAHAIGPLAATDLDGLISIPGLNCIDDFSIYLTDDTVRNRSSTAAFAVVQPRCKQARTRYHRPQLGTVVAYEVAQLSEGLQPSFRAQLRMPRRCPSCGR